MPELIRLTYASTVKSMPSQLRDDLINILDESNTYNFSHNIHGVLLFGNHYFYQCLEGSKTEIERLYEKIARDPRHQHVTQISLYPISILGFSIWQMKYVQLNREINQFFSNKGLERFDPYKIEGQIEDEFLAHLIMLDESNVTQEGLIAGTWGSMKGSVVTVNAMIYLLMAGLLICLILFHGSVVWLG